eukprot:Sspe_Gene.31962::Locus_15698_Transcript_1_1_Confidence_1.000_Length_1122::g.31962::m.31962
MRDAHASVRSVSRHIFSTRQVPCVPEHELEVLVILNPRAEVLVVLDELLFRDLVVPILVPRRAELTEDLLGGLRAVEHVRVVACVVSHFEVVHGDLPVFVLVQPHVGLLHHLQPLGVHLAPNANEKLRDADVPIVVPIKVVHNRVELIGGEDHPIMLQPLLQLRLIELLVSIVVHQAQDTGERADAVLSPALEDPFFDNLDDVPADRVGLRDFLEPKDPRAQLVDTQLPLVLLVMAIKEGVDNMLVIPAVQLLHATQESLLSHHVAPQQVEPFEGIFHSPGQLVGLRESRFQVELLSDKSLELVHLLLSDLRWVFKEDLTRHLGRPSPPRRVPPMKYRDC